MQLKLVGYEYLKLFLTHAANIQLFVGYSHREHMAHAHSCSIYSLHTPHIKFSHSYGFLPSPQKHTQTLAHIPAISDLQLNNISPSFNLNHSSA